MKRGCLFLIVLFFFSLLHAQNYQINSPDDDAEESAGYTTVTLNSPVIDLTADPTNPRNMKQMVGLRFTNVQLQKGEALSNCYLAFHVDQPANKVSMLAISGEKSGNAQPFQAINRNLSSRTKTIARINWNTVEPWTQAGAVMKSPDISKILTEIISLPDWAPGNPIVLLIEGNGQRHATAYDKNPQQAVQLVLNGGIIVASAPIKALPVSTDHDKPVETNQPVSVNTAQSGPSQINQSAKTPTNQSPSAMSGGSSLQETVNTSQGPVKFGLASQIEVTIPQGLAPAGTKLTVNKVTKEYKYDEINILNAMDITLSSGETFQKPLDIKMYFDKNKLADPNSFENIRPAYFDEKIQQWVQYTRYSVNTQEGSVSFKTHHLTVVSLFEFVTTGMYPLKFENRDCTIFYGSPIGSASDPLGNGKYNDHKIEKWYIDSKGDTIWKPFMIQDIAHWASVVKKAFRDSLKLDVPDKINIYVKPKDSFGEYGSVSGCMYLSADPSLPSPYEKLLSPNLVLKSTIAHEFVHVTQDYYYVMNKGKIGLWWLEALATQGDVMAYGKNHVVLPESQLLAITNGPDFLKKLMANPWDSFNESPEFYGTGIFLHYLSNYRSGKKADIATVLKDGGSNTDLSFFRTILDNYISRELSSSIGQEYADFVKWQYQNKVTKVKLPSGEGDAFDHVIKITEAFTTQDVSLNLPYLSAKIVKLRAPKNIEKEVKVETTVKSIDPGIKLFLCDLDLKNFEPVVVRELKVSAPDQSGMTWKTTTTLSSKFNYTNILVVNTNKDKSGSFNINIKNLAPPK
ncbi:MAG: hypothetical protein RBS73_15870 [Prolixibacteraceae bacterium]|jgi:hypothetical protein|nr:hypothetical protein [Prolixibacteraceae bacterium]